MNMKKNAIRVPAFVIMILLISISCKKETRNDNAAADVYVRSILYGGVPVYGLAQSVFGFAAMTKVTATTPTGTVIQLKANDSQNMIFYSVPTTPETYSTTTPQPGTYTYNITFDDGIEKILTNDLGANFLPPPVITSIAKSADGQAVVLSWEQLSGVDYFQLTISRQSTILYTSEQFAPISGNTLTIPKAVITDFLPGKTYKYQLDAINYESLETGQLQSVSSASASIVLNAL
jgi:hypothetical protein